MDGHYSNNNHHHQQQQQQQQLLFGSHHSVADIPLDQVAGGASFGDDFDLHRSVGGVATLLPAPVHFRRSIGGSPHHGGPHFGGYQQQHAALASVAALAPPKFTSTSSSSVSNKPPAPPAYARAAPVAETAAAAAPAEWEEAAIAVPELPPFDGFLEANDHVYLDGAQGVGAVTRLLEACFRRQRVDWSFQPGKCKWKAARVGLRGGSGGVVAGHHHSLGLGPASPAPLGWPLLPPHPIQHQERRVGGGAQGASVDFRCRVYKADVDGARLVLEFQRRQVRRGAFGFRFCV